MTLFGQTATSVLLEQYRSPDNTSVFKGVPIDMRERVLEYYRTIGVSVRLEFRGKREYKVLLLRSGGTYKQYDPSCRLRNAKTFAVYIRNRAR
jgi:hypothetical protein